MKIERMKDCEICQICWKMKNAKYYKISEIDAGFMFLCEDCLNELCKRWREIKMENKKEK